MRRGLRAMVATLALAALAAACGGRSSSGPAWPKSAGRVELTDPALDGGESLEPQQAAQIAAVEHAEDKTPAVDESIVVEAPAPPTVIAPDIIKPADATPPPGEVQIEVIEIKPEDLIVEP